MTNPTVRDVVIWPMPSKPPAGSFAGSLLARHAVQQIESIMSKSTGHKQSIRDYMREHGCNYTTALRAVSARLSPLSVPVASGIPEALSMAVPLLGADHRLCQVLREGEGAAVRADPASATRRAKAWPERRARVFPA